MSYSHYCGRLSLVCLSVYCLKVAFTSLLFLPSFHSMCFFPVIYFLKSSESKLVFSLCLFSLALNNTRTLQRDPKPMSGTGGSNTVTGNQTVDPFSACHPAAHHENLFCMYDTVTVDSNAVQIRQLMDTFGSFHKKKKINHIRKDLKPQNQQIFFFVH